MCNMQKKREYKKLKVSFITSFILFVCILASQYIGALISLGFVILYYSFVYKVFKEMGVIEKIKDWKQNEKLLVLGLYIISNILLLSILLKERYIRFWDFAGYWGVSIEVSDQIFKTPLRTLIDLYKSINIDEYNRLIPCIISFPLKVLGNSFTMYSLIIYNMFISITYIAIYGCIDKIHTTKRKNVIIISLTLMLTPAFYLPVLLGYLDAFALCNLALAYLIISTCYFIKFDFKKSILLSIALLLCLVGRRYFAFAVLGIVVSVVSVCLWQIVKQKMKKEIIINIIKNGCIVGGGIIVVLGLFFRQFLINSFDGTIAEAYSAYQTGGILENYFQLVDYYGMVIVILAMCGIFFCMRVKKLFGHVIVYGVSFIVATYMFYRIQSMGNHHYYITIVPLIVMLCCAIIEISRRNNFIFGITIVILLFNFIQANTDYVLSSSITKIHIFSNQKMLPKVRNDIPSLEAIVNKLKQYEQDGKTSYVLASSTVINDDLLRKIYMPDTLLSVNTMYVSSHVDLRDGFPTDFLKADIVVVANPVQYHLSQDSQRVIGLLANEFIQQKGIFHNYQHLEDYELDDGVIVSVYEKITEYSEEDLDYLRELFNQFYWEYPELFENKIRLN